MPGFFDALGQGMQTGGAILSPQVYQEQAQERQNAITNLANSLKVNQLQKKLAADQQFAEISKGLNLGGLRTSGEQLDAFMKAVPLDVLGQSDVAQQGLSTIMARQKQEEMQQAKLIQLQNQAAAVQERQEWHQMMANNQEVSAVERARHNLESENLKALLIKLTAGGQMDEGDLKAKGAAAATGMPLSQVVPGYGTAAVTKRDQVQAQAIKQIKEELGVDDEQAGREYANRQIDFAAGKRSSTQLNLMLGMTKQAVGQLDFNIKQASAAMDKLPSSDLSPVVNAIARGEQYWTGDPAYSELFFYMTAAAQESARILSGGQGSVAQLHEGARQEAQRWASINVTPKVWKEGVAPAMLKEGRKRVSTYQDALKSQRLGYREGEKAPEGEQAAPPVEPPKENDPLVFEGYRFPSQKALDDYKRAKGQ